MHASDCRWAALALALAVAVGCGKSSDEPKRTGDEAGDKAKPKPKPVVLSWYRAAIDLGKGRELPWFIGLPDQPDAKAIVVTGDERIECAHRRDGDAVVITWPAYDTEVRLEPGEGDALVGTFARKSKAFGNMSVPARARPVAKPDNHQLFPRGDAAPSKLGDSVWQFEVSDGDTTRALIRDKGQGMLQIGLQSETSDTADVVLVGFYAGNTLRASAFDGNFAYLLLAEVADDGKTLRGQWLIPGLDDRTIDGTRDDEFAMPPVVSVGDGAAVIDVALEERYKGKPLIVDIAASWCPPCQRAAPYFNELQKRYGPRGLEIVTLLYEFSGDPALNRQRATEFKRDHGIGWEVRPIDVDMEGFAASLPPALSLTVENVRNFPLVLFVDAAGRVTKVHTGFVGPEFPDEHARLKAFYEEHITKILATAESGG